MAGGDSGSGVTVNGTLVGIHVAGSRAVNLLDLVKTQCGEKSDASACGVGEAALADLLQPMKGVAIRAKVVRNLLRGNP